MRARGDLVWGSGELAGGVGWLEPFQSVAPQGPECGEEEEETEKLKSLKV